MKVVFLIAACASVLAVFLICVFLFANGLPAMGKIGPLKFLFGTEWRPTNDKFGILPMIVASIYVTAGAILIGVPIALFTSVFMARYCPKKIYKPLKSGIELMAGVPSIVYGYFWSGSPGTADPPAVRRNRKQYAGSMYPSGNHDPSDDHRSYGIGSTKRSGKLL